MRNILLICAAFGLAACQPQGDINTNSNVAVSNDAAASDCGIASDTIIDEKVLFAAETAYNIPAHAYVTLDAAGKLSPEIKTAVRPQLIKAYDYLKLARTAYSAGDGCSLKQYSNLAQAFANKAKSILPN